MSGKGAKGLSSGKGAKGLSKAADRDNKKKPVSRSARAGLQFPVGRIHRLLKVSSAGGGGQQCGAERLTTSLTALQGRVTANGRVGATAAVYTAAILGERAGALAVQLMCVVCCLHNTPDALQST